MSVINTNYLALVAQNNLSKSQNALGQAIERLSSGLRINSAKDDAAGQAIANRFTANVKGLTQASRNANDGISIAQTTEGALNEINNNLQRIRELSVQAANGSNSETDLKSIQDEISQRLDEIDRVSEQTQFNGKSVLSSKAESLKVQVGSQDSEAININLRAINRDTLGLSKLNMENQFVSKNAAGQSNFTPFTGTLNGLDNVTTVNNTIDAAVSATWTDFTAFSGINFSGFAASYDKLVVGDDNNLYAVVGTSPTAANNTYYAVTLDANGTKLSVAAASTAYGGIGGINSAASAAFDPGTGGGYVRLDQVSLDMIPSGADPTINGFYLENSGGGAGTTLWAEIGGTFYAASVTFDATGKLSSLTIDHGTSAAVAPGAALTSDTYLEAFGTPGVSLDYTAAAAAIGAAASAMTYVENGSGTQFVQVDDGSGNYTYYAASFNSTTGVITAASTATNTAPDLAGVNALLGASDTTLVQYAGKEGYFVQQGTGEDAKYYAADMTSAGTVTLTRADGQAATNAAQAAEAEVMVDPLSALDKALQSVDSLRSELGAVQNRFQSTIANLSNTINNLSAARSRIEDADYAVEVSNMTRAQILQQAGTSVLAQANQVPQTVLSLLR